MGTSASPPSSSGGGTAARASTATTPELEAVKLVGKKAEEFGNSLNSLTGSLMGFAKSFTEVDQNKTYTPGADTEKKNAGSVPNPRLTETFSETSSMDQSASREAENKPSGPRHP